MAIYSKLNLIIFDVLGQEVANLISGNLPAGSHEFILNHQTSIVVYTFVE